MKRIVTFLFAGIFVASALAGGLYLSGCGKSKKCCDNPVARSCRCEDGLTCNASENEVATCPDYAHQVVCCDDSGLKYCNCYESKSCTSGETEVSACPNYGQCCQDQDMADFCTCWDLTCSDTIGTSSQVSGCP
jgi:hypothetical protein